MLLEAQSMRLPVVSTRVEGCIDAVEDDVTGILVPAKDAAALERATLGYLRDAELRMTSTLHPYHIVPRPRPYTSSAEGACSMLAWGNAPGIEYLNPALKARFKVH